MLKVTEVAKKHLKGLLDSKSDDSAALLRLYVSNEGELSIGVDIAADGDEFVEYEKEKLLAVKKELSDKFSGVTLDVEKEGNDPQLVVSYDRSKGSNEVW
jgi:hypothetical protein